jgi:hypothetical protein
MQYPERAMIYAVDMQQRGYAQWSKPDIKI